MAQAEHIAGRVILLGYGTVGQCALPILFDVLGLTPEQVVVIDAVDRRDRLGALADSRLDFRVRHIDRQTLGSVVDEVAAPGDLLLNLSVGVDSLALADHCYQNGVLYVDTAIEPWEDMISDPRKEPPAARTEYAYHQRARQQAATRWRRDGPTAVFTHGANPGLVSHFTKAALIEVATAMGLDPDEPFTQREWARLAQKTGTKVIHISERDTQVSDRPKQPGEFVNTWSIPGFVEEAMMPVEIGWGTHECRLPEGALEHAEGPCNAIYMTRAAAQFWLRSWVPLGGQIAGLALPHSENITISDFLTLREDGVAAYRPTVAFVYLACDAAMASLHETMMRDWELQPAQRIMNDDIVAGRDELGVLLLGHGRGGWWYGSQLDVEAARRVVPGHNPTAIQVAASAVAAAAWALRNPAKGYCEPEDLPHDEILATARPYLGTMASQATDWTPLKTHYGLFEEPWRDPDDPWQFTNFLL